VFSWLEIPVVKWIFPVPMLLAIAPLAYWFFRRTWGELEADATAMRRDLAAAGKIDYRPVLTLTLGVLILTMQEYYGQMRFWDESVAPFIARRLHADRNPGVLTHLAFFGENYGRMWWAVTRIAGYLTPYLVWRFAFPKDSLLDMGLRVSGLRAHAWLYALFIVFMVPILLIVSRQPDFGAYYPICAHAGRSWVEFLGWEVVYVGQFVGLEMFFRGWWIRTTRIFGVGAIFTMAVPYSMIHFGKPYLEVCSAVIAGVVLGSLAIQTRSIWAGVLVHVTVAILNDILALDHKGRLPSLLTAHSTQRFDFLYWRAAIWVVWGAAIVVVLIKGVRVWPQARGLWRERRARLQP
jgi:hypothetical protein